MIIPADPETKTAPDEFHIFDEIEELQLTDSGGSADTDAPVTQPRIAIYSTSNTQMGESAEVYFVQTRGIGIEAIEMNVAGKVIPLESLIERGSWRQPRHGNIEWVKPRFPVMSASTDESTVGVHERLKALFQTTDTSQPSEQIYHDLRISLRNLLSLFGPETIAYLEDLLDEGDCNEVALSVGLEAIGDIEHNVMPARRRRLLIKALSNQSRWVRYGAAVGLANSGDVDSLPSLREAVQHEPVPEVKKAINRIVEVLEAM